MTRAKHRRTESELEFFKHAYLWLNICLIASAACTITFLGGALLSDFMGKLASDIGMLVGLVTTIISAVSVFVICYRLNGFPMALLYSFITATWIGWLIMFLLRNDLRGVLKRNGFLVAAFTARRED